MSRKTPNFVGRFSKKILRRYFWEIFLPEGNVFHCKFLPLQVVQKTGVGWKIEPQLVGVQRLPGLMIAAVHIALAVLAVPQQGAPAFIPVVADFYSGMEVTVPVFASELNGSIENIKEVYRSLYSGGIVRYADASDEGGFLSAGAFEGSDAMEISVFGNDERILLCARYDNLGKGASGAAIECMNLALGLEASKGLSL